MDFFYDTCYMSHTFSLVWFSYVIVVTSSKNGYICDENVKFARYMIWCMLDGGKGILFCCQNIQESSVPWVQIL